MAPALRLFFTLLSGEDQDLPAEDEVQEARRELEAALAVLRNARGAWQGTETVDVGAVRRALETAERQLDRARVRLQRAESQRRRPD